MRSVRRDLGRPVPGRRNAPDLQAVGVEIHVVVEHGNLDRLVLLGRGLVVGGFGRVVHRGHCDLHRRRVGEAVRVDHDVGETVGAVVIRVRQVGDAPPVPRDFGRAVLGGRHALDAQPVAVQINVVVEHGDLDRLILRGGGLVVGGFGRVVDRNHRHLHRRGVGEAARVGDDVSEAVRPVVVRVRRILHGRPGADHLRLPVSGRADRDHANAVSAIRIAVVAQDLHPRLPVLGHAQRVVRGNRMLVHIDHVHHDLRLRFAAERVGRRHGQRVAARTGLEVLPGADVAQSPRRRIDGETVGAGGQPQLDIVSIGIGHANATERHRCPAAVAVLGKLETRRWSKHRRTVHDFDRDFRSRRPTPAVVDRNPDDDAADAVRRRPPRIRPVGRARERSLPGAPIVCDSVAVRIRGIGPQPHLAAARNRAGLAGCLHRGRVVRLRRGRRQPGEGEPRHAHVGERARSRNARNDALRVGVGIGKREVVAVLGAGIVRKEVHHMRSPPLIRPVEQGHSGHTDEPVGTGTDHGQERHERMRPRDVDRERCTAGAAPGHALPNDGPRVRAARNFAAEGSREALLGHALDTGTGSLASPPERDTAPVHAADQRREVPLGHHSSGRARRRPVALERHLVGGDRLRSGRQRGEAGGDRQGKQYAEAVAAQAPKTSPPCNVHITFCNARITSRPLGHLGARRYAEPAST